MSEIPQTYEEWKHCIEIKCGIKLSKQYCLERVQDLTENKSRSAVSFTEKYGEEHTQKIISWFKQSLSSLSQ